MLEVHSKTNYNWLVLFIVIASTAMIGAGFDNDIPLFMSVLLVLTIIINTLICKRTVKINKTSISFGIYTVWAAISIIWSVTPIRTVIETMHLILYLLVYLFVQLISKEGKDKLINVILVVASGIALLGIFEYLFITGNRIHSTITNANPFAIFMVMFFLLTMSMSIRLNSIPIFALSSLFATTIFLSGSRAAIISLVASLVLVFFQIQKNKLRKAIISTLIVILISLAFSQLIAYFSSFLIERINLGQSILDQLIRKDTLISSSVNGRLEFWRVAYKLFTNRPLLGYGQGSYYSSYHIEYGMNQWYSRFAHNNILQILSETGLVGILLFLGFLLNIVKSVISQYRYVTKPIWFWGMTAGSTAFLMHTCVDFSWNFPAVSILFFFFISMMSYQGVDDFTEDLNQDKTHTIKRTILIPVLTLVMVLNIWHIASIQMLKIATEREQTESVSSALELAQVANSIYQVGSYGWSYESKLHNKLYQENGDPIELSNAIEAAHKAVELEPYNHNLNVELALLHKQSGDYYLTEKYLIDATKYSAYHMNALIELSSFYLEQGNKVAAISSLTEASNKSSLAISMANSDFEKALLVDTSARIYLTLASLHNESGDTALAQEQFAYLEKLASEYEAVQKYLNN